MSHVVAELNDSHGVDDTSLIVTPINVIDSHLVSTLSFNVNKGGLVAPRLALSRPSTLVLVIRYIHEP